MKNDLQYDMPSGPPLDEEIHDQFIQALFSALPELTKEEKLWWSHLDNRRFLASRLFSSLHVPTSYKKS